MIRPATEQDAAGIRAVHVAAFQTPLEADLVEALVREGDAVVSLVAERQGGSFALSLKGRGASHVVAMSGASSAFMPITL